MSKQQRGHIHNQPEVSEAGETVSGERHLGNFKSSTVVSHHELHACNEYRLKNHTEKNARTKTET